MLIDQAQLGDQLASNLLENGWTESRKVMVSRHLKCRLKRRGYVLHESAEMLLESLSGITLQNRHYHSTRPWTMVIKFLSDEYFPAVFSFSSCPEKHADATLLKEITGLNACLLAHVYYAVPDESAIKADVPSDFLIYALPDQSFSICDSHWHCAWSFDSIEEVLGYSLHNLFDPDTPLVFDAGPYRSTLEKLRLGS